MRHDVSGTVLEVALDAGEGLFSPINAMLWVEPGIEIVHNRDEGFFAGLKRALSDFAFRIDYVASTAARLALVPRLPGTIRAVRLEARQTMLCRAEVLLGAERTVEAAIDLDTKIGSLKQDDGLFWRLTGPGTVFLGIPGTPIARELAQDERLTVSAAHIAALEGNPGVRISWLPGLENLLAGQSGYCVATLSGPGRVILQTAPIVPLAEAIGRLIPRST